MLILASKITFLLFWKNKDMKYFISQITILMFISLSLSCAGIQEKELKVDPNEEFLKKDPAAEEVFRVLISSDRYAVSQMRNYDTIRRVPDPGGDRFISSEVGKYDKINEAREATVKICLYPDCGRLIKVRPIELTYLVEIDNLIIEDIQRWTFSFPGRVITPSSFDIKYRVVLQKKQTDEEIMREVREDLRQKRISR